MTNYSKQWSTATPGYLIFLIDQSSSMEKPWTDGNTFAQYTAEVINQTINELIATNAAGETVKNRVFISLIGYGGSNSIDNLRSDYLSNYAENPIRIEKFSKKVSDGAGGWVDMEIEMPIFLEPKASGVTPMSGAFELAKRLIQGWILKKNDNPVPVVINVSDGRPEGGSPELNKTEIEQTILVANDIMRLQTLDGYPLIFNVHIARSGAEIKFPEYEFELNGDSMAELLFKISSEVPMVYKQAAKDLNLKSIGGNAKGFISNASPETLLKFINFGSSGGINRSTM
ncbi:MAG: VWA domain-containing protein [Bacteroidota bacterium]|nr:VWA domain-containing protein [Bacteroidota bacterium]